MAACSGHDKPEQEVAWNPPLLRSQLRRIAIAIQFCKDISRASSVEGIMSGQIPRPFRSIALVAALLISGAGVTVLSATARADDCLTAPNSAAPQGSHWYYRLDRASQRQCWYTRAPGQPAQQVAAPGTTGLATASHSTPTPSVARSRPVSAAPSPKVKTAAKPITAPISGGTTDKTVQQSAQSTASTPETPAPQSGTLSLGETSSQTAAPPAVTSPDASAAVTSSQAAAPPAVTLPDQSMAVAPVKAQEPISQAAAPPAVTSPDQSMAVAPVKAQEPIEVPTNAPANPVSDDAERTDRRADPTNRPGMPIIIFTVLALGLVGVGVVIKIAAARRRARITTDQPEPYTVDDHRQHEWRDDQYPHIEGQEFRSLLSALREPSTLRDLQETSERKDKLLQFFGDMDRMLQSPARRTAA